MAAKQERMLSFGVEMEFYIFFCVRGKNLTSRPPGFESHPGGPLIVEKFDETYDLFNPLLERLRSVLEKAPKASVLSVDDRRPNIESDQEWNHLNPFREWDMHNDPSLHRLPDELVEITTEQSGWVGVELISPALWTTNEGFDQVRRVCVKIGHLDENESEIDDLDNTVIISGTRKAGRGRFSSVLGFFRTKNEEVRVEDNFPARPTTQSYTIDPQTLNRSLNRVRLAFGIEQTQENFSPTPLLEAVAEILRTTNRENIAELLRTPIRSAYNFQQLAWEVKRTIEFRQAASTIDPAEVVSRARIAVRLCEFAANATHQQLHKMFFDFSVAEVDPRWLDVYDLFVQLDLRPEARVVQAALTGTISESVRDAYFTSRK
ncbi:uncharacterized protein F4807DRAFT_455161 [Annulohypoxylon truncatum]|uniref:uncharacterized protein n=1 Tax=Annulohypoxylon truncatum TaxID=327061 RepID=UPI0020076331|nr:uncharacterized protein F4807DRAFT_455161 [Annulohypoxylon truncatum]KAI1214709.1 hypothetical protein F4807DRAFT_455161 [Annulohypoxylon truncatum]